MKQSDNSTSKFLSLVLRHKPETIGIKLTSDGWADVSELIKGMKITLADLERIVASDSKGRYTFEDDSHKRIRAAQGHSLKVDLGLESKIPPKILYHGTDSRFLKSILSEGLKPMSRTHVHLSADLDTAKTVGSRRKKDNTETHIFKLDTVAMLSDGVKFYQAENGVWLVDRVDPKYLK